MSTSDNKNSKNLQELLEAINNKDASAQESNDSFALAMSPSAPTPIPISTSVSSSLSTPNNQPYSDFASIFPPTTLPVHQPHQHHSLANFPAHPQSLPQPQPQPPAKQIAHRVRKPTPPNPLQTTTTPAAAAAAAIDGSKNSQSVSSQQKAAMAITANITDSVVNGSTALNLSQLSTQSKQSQSQPVRQPHLPSQHPVQPQRNISQTRHTPVKPPRTANHHLSVIPNQSRQRLTASAQPVPNAPQNARTAPTKRQITQEQVIVGHFCRHSLKLLTRVMGKDPNAARAEEQLKEHIKKVWAQWVKGEISRPQLLESVASFVRKTCPSAANLDVVQDFKKWYEIEFERQKLTGTLRRSQAGASQPVQQVQAHSFIRAAQDRPHAVQGKVLGQLPTPGNAPATVAVASANSLSRGQGHLPQHQPPGGLLQPVSVSVPTATQGVMAALGAKPGLKGVIPGTSKKVQGDSLPVQGGVSVTRGVSTAVVPANTAAGRVVVGISKPQLVPGAGRGTGKVIPRKFAGKSLTIPPTGSNSEVIPGMTSAMAAGVPSVMAGGAAAVTAAATPTDLTALGVGSQAVSGVPAGIVLPGVSNVNGAGVGVSGLDNTPTSSQGVKTLTASKGLLAAKSPSVGKPKGARKPPPKPPGLKTPSAGRGSPVSSKSKGPLSPSAESAGGSSGQGVGEKRPADMNGISSTSPASKKAKAAVKQRPAIQKKKAVVPVALPAVPAPKTGKPPPARPESTKKAGVGGGVGLKNVGVGGTVAGGPGGGGNASQQTPGKRAKGVDEELNVTNGVIDIEEEAKHLARREDSDEVSLVVENMYPETMLLGGGRLRLKMQATAKRFMLDENISSHVMKMMSLAVEERLRLVLESLKESCAIRTEMRKREWDVESEGEHLHEKLEEMRDDEERRLTVAADERVKRLNEKRDAEEKKANGESITAEKKKESSAAADAERKEKLAQEKKRKESSSQRVALAGLLEGIYNRGKSRPNTSKGLAPLKPLGDLSSSKSGLGSLPPIGRKAGSESIGSSGRNTKGIENDLSKLSALGPIGKGGGRSGVSRAEKEVEVKEPLTLRDCLFVMENEVQTRRSTLYFKWSSRVGMYDGW